MKKNVLKWVNTFALAATVTVNALANILPLGIGSTGAVSEKYANLFTPTGATFAIWCIIYLFMTVYVLYGWGLLDKGLTSTAVTEKVGLWFALSCLANIGWIFAWHFDVIWLSLIFIVGLLLVLARITTILRKADLMPVDRFAAEFGFGLYFGWIIAATIANVSVLLTALKWTGFGLSPVLWTCLVLAVGAAIGGLVAVRTQRYTPTLGVIWAYVGILLKHIDPEAYAGKHIAVILTAIFGIAWMGVALYAAKCGRCRKCDCDKPQNPGGSRTSGGTQDFGNAA